MVSIVEISQDTRSAWTEYLGIQLDLYENDIKAWLPLDTACMFLQILKVTEDKPEIFPRGKWASIQLLEDAINKCILDEIL